MSKEYDFKKFKEDALVRPRDEAFNNWFKFEEVGDQVQGFIRDAFFRPADGLFKEQRGITLEKPNGELINVGIKRLPFILSKTDDLHIGDPLTIVFEKEQKSSTKGYNPTKIFAFYGKKLEENASNPTVRDMEDEDIKHGGTGAAKPEEGKEGDSDDQPF